MTDHCGEPVDNVITHEHGSQAKMSDNIKKEKALEAKTEILEVKNDALRLEVKLEAESKARKHFQALCAEGFNRYWATLQAEEDDN